MENIFTVATTASTLITPGGIADLLVEVPAQGTGEEVRLPLRLTLTASAAAKHPDDKSVSLDFRVTAPLYGPGNTS
jgi:hypothetical protein